MKNNNLFSVERKIIDLNSVDMFSIESFATLQKISGNKIDEKNQIIHDMRWIELDIISRNNSLYESMGFVPAMEAPYIRELQRRGTWMGELDHPDPNCSRERFMKVDKDNISHRMLDWRREGNNIVGNIQMMAPKGPVAWDWIKKGANISLSTRVLTPNYKEEKDSNGNVYIRKFGNMRLVTFDMISSAPGFKSCSIVEDVDSYDASRESFNGIKSIRWTNKRKKDEFMRLLESQESLPILEDLYGFSMKNVKNISYSEEGLITINIERNAKYTKSIKIPTNVYKVNQVLGTL